MEMTRLRALGRRIAAHEDELLAEPFGDEALRQDLARRAARRPARLAERRRRRVMLALASVLASAIASAGAVVAGVRLYSPTALTFTVGDPAREGRLGEWVSANLEREAPVRFSDGTRVALAPGSRGRVVSAGPHGAEVVIESGRASVRVVPDDRGEFRIRTGPFVVQVHGTQFTVSWDPSRDEFLLALHEGRVTVSGCVFGEGRTVQAGETVRASCAAPAIAAPVGGEAAVLVAPLPSGSASPPPTQSAESVGERSMTKATPAASAVRAGTGARAANLVEEKAAFAPPSWLELARAGLYDEAYRAATTEGFAQELAARNSSEVFLLGDVARHAGRRDNARSAYEAVRNRFPGSDDAATAAFALGRLAFDGSRDYERAATWLETYLAERPAGPMSAAAMGRLLEARIALGQRAKARDLAHRYLALHPDGPLSNEAKKVIDAGE